MRYLLLDDDVTYCLSLQEMLDSSAVVEVDFACTIEAALDKLHYAARSGVLPDVILCDYNLSEGRSGFDFFAALRAEEFDIPAVLLTDYDDPEVIQRAEEEFGAVHIQKTGLHSAELVQQIAFFAFRRWAEQRRQANQQMRRQASNMLLVGAEIAHEFKEIIRVTKLQLDGLHRALSRNGISTVTVDRRIEQLEPIFNDGLRLSDMLMRYGGEIKGHIFKLDRTDIAAEVKSVARLPEFKALTIRINGVIQTNEANVDAFVVRRVLSVLFRNILDHANGSLDVDVAIGETARVGGKALYIDVEDHGPGINLEHRNKIFEAGERAGRPIHYHGGGGLGLGLGFAKTLVEFHAINGARGAIHCLDGNLGAGARFRISLPQE